MRRRSLGTREAEALFGLEGGSSALRARGQKGRSMGSTEDVTLFGLEACLLVESKEPGF